MQEELSHLVYLTQLYIHQEYGIKDWKETDAESIEYYRSFVRPEVQKKPRPVLRKPLPLPQQKEEKSPISKTFERQKISADTSQTDLHDIRSTFEKVSPHLKIKDPVPQPISQKERTTDEVDALILSLNDHPEHHAFLIKIAVAIKNKKGKARAVTVTSPADVAPHLNPKIVVCTKQLLINYPDIQWSEPTKVIELSSVADYLNHTEKKRKLWNAICSTLKL